MSIRQLLPQRHRILFVVAVVVLRLAIYAVFLFKFFILMTVPQSILAYVATLAIVAGIWKLAGWYVPKETPAGQEGPIVHPLVGAPGQFAGTPSTAAIAVPASAATMPASTSPVATLTPAAPRASVAATPSATVAPTQAAARAATAQASPTPPDLAVNIFAVPAMRVTTPLSSAEPTVIVPAAPAAPHESAAALVAAMGSTWPTTAGPSFERPLPAWTPPAAPQFSGARA